MRPVDLSPIGSDEQTARPLDLFLIFVGANIVATTLQVGASLPPSLPRGAALAVIAAGALGGAGLVAALAPIGSRLGVPSIVAVRAVLGFSGAHLLALLLFLTNFAWIALNNVIAASVSATVSGISAEGPWAAGLGLIATVIVWGGPRAAAVVDRVAVPLLLAAGAIFTVACARASMPPGPDGPLRAADAVAGLDMVAGYQASWLLMFADYPRLVRDGRAAALAVFLGLALTALWFMPLGLAGSAIARSADPGDMVTALELGWWGVVLLTLATITTNFVNIYMSALALKSLRPSLSSTATVWVVGGGGAVLSLLSDAWLERFASLTLILAGLLVPVGGILLAHYFLLRRTVVVSTLYDANGPLASHRGWSVPGSAAWAAGALVFYVAQGIGSTLPCLVTSLVVYACLASTTARASAAAPRAR